MSDQDTPPPMDDNPSDQDAPPPAGNESKGESVLDSLPTEAPPTAGIGLGQGKMEESEEKTMALLSHILGAVTCVIGPLIIWVMKKDDSPFVNDQGKEAINFQMSVLIVLVVSALVNVVPFLGQCFSLILWATAVIGSLIFSIQGGIASNQGKVYRYPFALRIIS